MAVKIAGNTGAIAQVDASNNLNVNMPLSAEQAGFINLAGEVNSDEGAGRIVRALDVTPDYRLRVGIDSLLFSDTFCHAQVNTSKYKIVNTTMTNALSGSRWVLNNGNSVTAAQGTQVQSYANFKLYLSYPLYIDFQAALAQYLQANNVVEFGMLLCSGVAAPTDGAFFRMNAAGVPQGVINYNGSETAVTLVSEGTTPWVPSPNNMYHFLIVLHNDRTEWWIDDVCVGVIETPAVIGSPTSSMALPLAMRVYNSGTVTTAQRLEVSNVSLSFGDQNLTRLWQTTMSVMGQNSANIPDGTAAGFTSNNANSAAPVSATLSNTAAGYATLGGQWQFAAVVGAETDYALFGYLNPAGTGQLPGKNLIIQSVRIDTYNTVVASATTSTLLQWTIGVGSTNVSIATADNATTGARAPRRLSLGVQTIPVTSPVGYACNPVDVRFDAPLVVESGTYCHIILKMPIGTATSTQVIRGTCEINGYFE